MTNSRSVNISLAYLGIGFLLWLFMGSPSDLDFFDLLWIMFWPIPVTLSLIARYFFTAMILFGVLALVVFLLGRGAWDGIIEKIKAWRDAS